MVLTVSATASARACVICHGGHAAIRGRQKPCPRRHEDGRKALRPPRAVVRRGDDPAVCTSVWCWRAEQRDDACQAAGQSEASNTGMRKTAINAGLTEMSFRGRGLAFFANTGLRMRAVRRKSHSRDARPPSTSANATSAEAAASLTQGPVT
jgi:hypothetical protein